MPSPEQYKGRWGRVGGNNSKKGYRGNNAREEGTIQGKGGNDTRAGGGTTQEGTIQGKGRETIQRRKGEKANNTRKGGTTCRSALSRGRLVFVLRRFLSLY